MSENFMQKITIFSIFELIELNVHKCILNFNKT